jgi:hypothetical protein
MTRQEWWTREDVTRLEFRGSAANVRACPSSLFQSRSSGIAFSLTSPHCDFNIKLHLLRHLCRSCLRGTCNVMHLPQMKAGSVIACAIWPGCGQTRACMEPGLKTPGAPPTISLHTRMFLRPQKKELLPWTPAVHTSSIQ